MGLPKVKKQSYEEFSISASILNIQSATEEIVLGTSTVTATDKDGADVSSTLLDSGTKALGNDEEGSYSNNMLSIQIQGGLETLSPYKVTFKMVTTESNNFEVDVAVVIKEL